jgi:acetoin utilization deacetylase AcuC-like enzyme
VIEGVNSFITGKWSAEPGARRLRSFLLSLALAGLTHTEVPGGATPKAPPGTGFVYDALYLKHDTGANHPERPERLTAILQRLEQKGLLEHLVRLKPAPASTEWVTTVHTAQYLERVRTSCQAGTGYVDSPDAPASAASYEAALLAVGGVQAAVDAVMDGRIRNAFCAIRPPGHHALKDKAMGFCLFNNIAIAAKYIQKKHKLGRVLIVDWDVHHGNGTQAAFYDDPTVFYFSIHQSPFYPGSGGAEERGTGKGLGFTRNVPLKAGSGDADYRRAFVDDLEPAAAAFKPDFVLISAGFDAAQGDLLGGMKVTPAGFAELTRIAKDIADRHCQGRLVSVLEGGYGLESLAASVEAHVRILLH